MTLKKKTTTLKIQPGDLPPVFPLSWKPEQAVDWVLRPKPKTIEPEPKIESETDKGKTAKFLPLTQRKKNPERSYACGEPGSS
jgi:hypothetical protein